MKKSKYFKVFIEYGIHLWIVLFIANIALLYAIHFFIIGATCMTPQQVAADTSRCLYIYGKQVFNVGSPGNEHHGHPCGTDVTSVIPSSHIGNQASYLLPNYVADICSASTPSTAPSPSISQITVPSPGCLAAGGCPTDTPTPSPTMVISLSMAPSISLAPTLTPTAAPSSTLTTAQPSTAISLSLSGFPTNGNPDSIINFLEQLLQQLINLINSLGGNLSGRHGGSGGHHHHHHDND